MIDQCKLSEQPEVLTAAIPIRVLRTEIQTVMGPAFGELFAVLAAQGIAPAGPTLTFHTKLDPDWFEFEAAVAVASPVAPSGRVVPSRLPAGPIASCIHRGPYQELHEAWQAFEGWLAAQPVTRLPYIWEVYRVGPGQTPDPAAWETDLVHPLAAVAQP